MAHSSPMDIPSRTNRGTRTIPVDMVPFNSGMHDGGVINPDPVEDKEDMSQDLTLEEYLSPRRLRELTGVDDLDEVEYLELRVNTSETTLGNFGVLVPNLKQLKLTGSSIQSVRDLGSSLDNLQTLWMPNTGLQDVDGLSSMCNLRELYLAFNDITDLTPCSMLDELRILDLEGNQLDDICQIEFLALCSKLVDLTLRGNPFCEKLSTAEYRKAVFDILPNLKNLDDKDETTKTPTTPRSPREKESAKPVVSKQANPFSDDWNLLNQLAREGTIGNDSVLTDSGYSSVTSPATTAAGRATTARPLSSRPFTSVGIPFRPSTSRASTSSPSARITPPMSRQGRPSSSISPATSLLIEEQAEGETGSSLLTKGPVFCGNPSRALRRRREFATSTISRENTGSSTRSSSATSQHETVMSHQVFDPENAAIAASQRVTSATSLKDDADSLLEDVTKWKTMYQEASDKRKSEKAKPDVLVINQGAADSDDEDEEELSFGQGMIHFVI